MANLEILIPISFFVVVAFIVVQVLQHRQRMLMIEKGVTRLEFTEIRNRSLNSIKYGLVTIALGLAIFMAQVFDEFIRSPFGGEIGLALVPMFVGVALIVSAIIEKRAEKEQGASTHR